MLLENIRAMQGLFVAHSTNIVFMFPKFRLQAADLLWEEPIELD